MSTKSLPKGALLQKNKNGFSYAYFPQYFYDAQSDTKRKGRHKKLYIGKVDEAGNFYPNKAYLTNPKLTRKDVGKTQIVASSSPISTRSFGSIHLLNELAQKTELIKDMESVFGKVISDQLFSLACFMLMTQNSSLYLYSSWAKGFCLKNRNSMDSQAISRLLKNVGENEQLVQELFKKRIKRIKKKEFLAYDSCKIGSEAQNINDVRWAPSKSGAMQQEFGLALLCGQTSKMPVMYRTIPGNMADVKTVKDLICRWEELGITKDVTAILDRGYNSQINMTELCANGIQFVIGQRVNTNLAKETIEDHMADFWMSSSYLEEYGLYAVSAQKEIKNEQGKKYRIWVHAYRSDRNSDLELRSFYKKLSLYEKLWLSGKASKTSELYKYFEPTEQDVGAQALVRNHNAIDEAVRYKGFFCFASNKVSDPKTALEIYRGRDCVEKTFKNLQTELDMDTSGVHNDFTLHGKLLVCFVALTLLAELSYRMEQTTVVEGQDYDRLYDEYSVNQVLFELNNIKLITIGNAEPRVSEFTKKQELIYRRLGVKTPAEINVTL